MTTTIFDKETMRRRVGGLRREIFFAVLLTIAAVLYFFIGGLHQPAQDEAGNAPVVDLTVEKPSSGRLQ
jgi:hypothetical protein